jgi:hypothetical protein
MKTYTLHLASDARPGDPDALERAILVRDGFSWGAFLFGPLWFFANRLWLAGLAILAAYLALGVTLRFGGLPAGPRFLIALLAAILVGLEANSLRRWTLRRGGRPAVDVVARRRRDEAETELFRRWLTGSRPQAASPAKPAPQAYPVGAQPVLGLFPEAERFR